MSHYTPISNPDQEPEGPLEENAEPSVTTEPDPSWPAPDPATKKKGVSKQIASGILLAVAVICAVVVLVFVLDKSSALRLIESSGPGSVTVLDSSTETDSVGVADDVYRLASPAVVRISQPGGGVGSGFFYAPGKIVTNAHVVTTSEQAQQSLAAGEDVTVDILLADGRERQAVIAAIDIGLDLAILSVGEDLDVPSLGFASTEPKPGSFLAAIGHPFGESQMITTGIMSGLASNSRFAESEIQSILLQIDVAVNPGNSGGPVLDEKGRVVGIVTLRPDEADGRAVTGLALAIPARVAAAAIEQLEQKGQVDYPLLGVTLQDTTSDDTTPDAAEILTITPGSAADKAGLEVGDVIVLFDGEKVDGSQAVVLALAGRLPGEEIPVGVVRAGVNKTFDVVLGARTE